MAIISGVVARTVYRDPNAIAKHTTTFEVVVVVVTHGDVVVVMVLTALLVVVGIPVAALKGLPITQIAL